MKYLHVISIINTPIIVKASPILPDLKVETYSES